VPNCVILSDRISTGVLQDLEPTSSPTAAILCLNCNCSGWGLTRPGPAPKAISSPAVRQKPETLEQWAALTKAWEASYGFEPELEEFQQIIELLWNHQRRDG